MKRIFLFVITVAVMATVLLSCSSASKGGLEKKVVYDENGVVITILGLSERDGDPSIELELKNGTKNNITVQTRNFSTDGYMVRPSFSCALEPGKSAVSGITLDSNELKLCGIDTPAAMEFYFYIYNTSNFSPLWSSDIIALDTGKTVGAGVSPLGTQICKQDGVTIWITGSNSELEDPEVYVYIENNNDRDITVQEKNVKINGITINPLFSADIASGKKAVGRMQFDGEKLEDMGIENISDCDASFSAYDEYNTELIFETASVKAVL